MIYITGANETLTAQAGCEYNFMEVGYNTGNMAIARGVKDVVRNYFGVEAQRYNSSANISPDDLLVIGAANWISNSVNLDWIFYPGIDRFRRILVLGLGVQNDINDLYEVSPSGRKFLDWIFGADSVICTRDTKTFNLLSKYKKKIFWTGCPSLRIQMTMPNNKMPRSGFSYGGSIEVISHSTNSRALRDFEKSIITNYCTASNFNKYILQAEFPLMDSINNNNLNKFSNYLEANLNLRNFEAALLINRFEYFFDIDEWLNSLLNNSLFFGTRLHGNILAWHAGVKSFLLAHDARTKAFLEDFGFPGMSLDAACDVSFVIDQCRNVDYEIFEQKLKVTLENLNDAVTELGLV